MARSMTLQEKLTFKNLFPMLDVNAAVVTGEAIKIYNCISWTVGVTDRWLWPGESISNFDTFYRQCGFIKSRNGPVAAWGVDTSNMTHGCISGLGHGPRWESKCGADLRIQHGLTELESVTYGRVLAFYDKAAISTPFADLAAESAFSEDSKTMELSSYEKSVLKKYISSNVPKDVQTTFEKYFAAWKMTWFTGDLAINSNPHSRAHGKDFDDLVALGPQIIPLVIEALTDDENFFALVLYDTIQSDDKLIVQYEPDDPKILAGEQGRAALAVGTWLNYVLCTTGPQL